MICAGAWLALSNWVVVVCDASRAPWPVPKLGAVSLLALAVVLAAVDLALEASADTGAEGAAMSCAAPADSWLGLRRAVRGSGAGAGVTCAVGLGGAVFSRNKATPITPTSLGRPVRLA